MAEPHRASRDGASGVSAEASLATDPAALRARRRPTLVTVRFAEQAGHVETLEGPVRHQAGDALVTGESGELWPVGRTRFLETHEPVEGTLAGCDGIYRRRSGMVMAKRLSCTEDVVLSGARGTLHGDAGDWLVEYAPGDAAIVAADIFERTYELVAD
jgi:hypothetical protein